MTPTDELRARFRDLIDRAGFKYEQDTAICNEVLSRLAEVERDAERLDWLDGQGEAYGFEDTMLGRRWLIDGAYDSLRSAIDAARGKEGVIPLDWAQGSTHTATLDEDTPNYRGKEGL